MRRVLKRYRLNNARLQERLLTKLSILLRGYPGRVRLYLPRLRTSGDIKQLLDGGKITKDDGACAQWAQQHLRMIEENLTSGRPFDTEWSKQRMIDIRDVMESGIVIDADGRDALGLDRIDMGPDQHQTVVLRFDRPADCQVGQFFEVEVQQLDAAKEHQLIGGITARVEIVPEPKAMRRSLRVGRTTSSLV